MLMRRVFDRLHTRTAAEVALTALRAPPLAPVAGRVFFGRGSFPDLDLEKLLGEKKAAALANPIRRRFALR